MSVPAFDYRRWLSRHRREVDRAVARVMDSGVLINGPYVAELEKRFAAFVGARYAVGVASGTDALFLSLKALDIGAGDEVITVPNTAVPTVSAIISAGATPVFVDVDPTTYLMDTALVARALSPRTRAIVPVHLFGQSADMKAVMRIARGHDLAVIEDCAQAHGTRCRGRSVGTFGATGCFSFYPTKNMGAFGDGGMIVTNSRALRDRLRLLKSYGEKKRHVNVCHGYNSRLDELQASILLVRLHHLGACNERRAVIARLYDEAFEGTRVERPHRAAWSTHVYHQYVVQLPRRDAVRAALARRGIATGIHYPLPIHLQKAYRRLGYGHGSFPVCERVQRRILSLPMFPELRDTEVKHAARALRDCLGAPGS